jgi:hypothetical protein
MLMIMCIPSHTLQMLLIHVLALHKYQTMPSPNPRVPKACI